MAAWENHEHELIEAAFYDGLPHVTDGREWRRVCDDLHRALERPPDAAPAADLLDVFRRQGVPIILN